MAHAMQYALHSGITVALVTPYLTSIYNIKRDGCSFLSKVHKSESRKLVCLATSINYLAARDL